MTTNTIPAPVEEQLTTDNVGAVEANENEVETTEQQDEKSTISKEEKSAEENASELSSDNLDITESTSQ
ncbi:MAG: hypothetical protein LBD11_07115 [Candidatus Peribacteria bacterium]|jgi:hypothetical protein|nr:hypothetical protein [Candidatus Peribacteria bacterium]